MRVAVFTDRNGPTTASLIRRIASIAADRRDIELAALVSSRPGAFLRDPWTRRVRRTLRAGMVSAANRGVAFRWPNRDRIDVGPNGMWHRVPLVSPPGGDPNAPDFVRFLTGELGIDVAMSIFCLRIFRASLLGSLDQAVNFHDGLLPHYRGLGATGFSIYEGAPESGFTFHRMTELVDGGAVLAEGSVVVNETSVVGDVMARKREAAVAVLEQVLERMGERDPGAPQLGSGRTYTARDVEAIVRVATPEQVTEAELRRRVRAFGALHVTIDGSTFPLTGLRRARRGGRLAFRTADGCLLEPARIAGLPPLLATGLTARAVALPSRRRG